MSGEQNWEWNQNDALKAAGTITDLRLKLSQAEQLRDQYRGDLVVVNEALNGHAREIIRLTAELATANDYRYELKTVIEAMKLATESRDLQIGSLQFQLNEMRDHRDRWYGAAGQRQDELNEAHAAIRQLISLVRATKVGEPREAIWLILKQTENVASQNRAARAAMQGKL